MRKFAALTAVSAAALLATPAAAQVVAGPRIEALAGWDNIKTDIESPGDQDSDLNEEGLVYGIGVGYDFPVGPGFAVGVDLEATKSDVDIAETEELFIENDPLIATDDEFIRTRTDLSAEWDWYAGARATFAASESLLFYLKGGYTRLRVKGRVLEETTIGDGDPVEVEFRDRENLSGWRVGVGAQFTNGRFYAGPEYRYSRYEDDVRRHQIVGVVGLRFGPRAEPLPPPPPVEAPPPPPPPPVATQTCPDGTVIPATEVCPAPPPPPPPPPSGERG